MLGSGTSRCSAVDGLVFVSNAEKIARTVRAPRTAAVNMPVGIHKANAAGREQHGGPAAFTTLSSSRLALYLGN